MPLVAQSVRSEDRREERGLGEIVVQGVAFVIPAQPVGEREVRLDLPGVLPIEVEGIVVIGVPFLEGRRLANVAQAEAKTLEREVQDVGEHRKGLGKYGKQTRQLLIHFSL